MQGDSAHPALVENKENMKLGGRPKKAPADRRIIFVAARFDAATVKRLDAWCSISDYSRAQAIRTAVKEFLERAKKAA
jgi:hypothetical protein